MVQALFDRVSERLLREDGAVEQTRMMNSDGLKIAGKFFAMVSRGSFTTSSSRPGRGIASTPATAG